MKKRILAVAAAVVVIGAGAWLVLARKGSSEPKYRKAKLDKGDVVATVTATGTLSAVTTVKVGSQVSGIIAKLYVDFNSTVKKGQILAELDPTPFQQAVEQSRANLDKAKVQLRNAEIGLTRAKKLFGEQLIAQSDLDAAQTTRDSDMATVAQVTAQLKQAETNLSYTKINSPIDGVVVDRQYDIGQTVAASFQAPVTLHDRAGPHEDAGPDEHRRGGRRPREGRAGRELLGRRVSRSSRSRAPCRRSACRRRPSRTS